MISQDSYKKKEQIFKKICFSFFFLNRIIKMIFKKMEWIGENLEYMRKF